jgi:hypothetical protein
MYTNARRITMKYSLRALRFLSTTERAQSSALIGHFHRWPADYCNNMQMIDRRSRTTHCPMQNAKRGQIMCAVFQNVMQRAREAHFHLNVMR